MKPISTFTVRPALPEPLRPLLRIAHNLRWSWDHAAIDLFRRLDREGWEACNHNPVLLLGTLDQSVLEAAAQDEPFLAHQLNVANDLDQYLSRVGAWYQRVHHGENDLQVAYFSAEFGITECLSVFAGGLGVLAGDHLKASSDLGLPMVGVGLLYQQGYFRQYLNAAGWQQEAFENNDFHTWPIELVPNIVVEVELPGGAVAAQVWRVNIGRLQLYLLDTNIPLNRAEHRKITDQLYGGDLEVRLKQEILLGIGGYRALEAIGLKPTVYHMNEGHSAFLGIEHILRLMETQQLSFSEGRLLASPGLMDRYFSKTPTRLGITRSDFLGLGRQDPDNEAEDFCMTALALRLASFSNGVSKLHGCVSRRMWNRIWKDVPEREVPIGHVTNGVHFRSWVSNEMNLLYDRYLGPKWREEPADVTLWQHAEFIPAPELWSTHERRRERLVSYARTRLRAQLQARGASKTAIEDTEEFLNPDALTIGFGRRFASYKRATLLLRNPERLARLLNDRARPVQIIYAGKAHPKDEIGKQLIKAIIDLAARPEVRRKIVFLENYDMAIARHMVQGCDIWLNTPLRPHEASGTSGMKAQANGVLNVSTLDGWWDEAWRMGSAIKCEVGWAIGSGESYEDPSEQDNIEAEALYDLLEREIVPLFYDRRTDGLPRKWIARMKTSIATLCPEFNMHRMVMQYATEYYLIAHRRFQHLHAQNSVNARHLAAWLNRIRAAWPRVSLDSTTKLVTEIRLGDQIPVSARVALNGLAPNDVTVQLVAGKVNGEGNMEDVTIVAMDPIGHDSAGDFLFQAILQPCARSGLHGYAIRVLPQNTDAVCPFIPGLITWVRPASAVPELQLR
jgi:glycogen phosphorylase